MILVCGEALMDVFVDRKAGRSLSLEALAGGSPFNVAIGLARLGCPTAFLTTLSDDVFGTFIRDKLAEAGVQLDYVKHRLLPTALSVVAIEADGQPRYAFYTESTADRALTVDDLPPSLGESVSAIAVGSYVLGVEPIASTIEALLLREWQRRVISLDPNVRPRIVGDLGDYRKRFERLLPATAIIKASLEDIALLYGKSDPIDVARGWISRGPCLVILTRGSDGPQAIWHDGTIIERSSQQVVVVDTVGAGDSFHAAFLAFLAKRSLLNLSALRTLNAADIGSALDFSLAAAAVTCSRRGADLPTWPEVEEAASQSRRRTPV